MDDRVREILFDSDSDEGDFEGFLSDDLPVSSDEEDDVPLADLDDPKVGSYKHPWLRDFSCRSGPLIHDENSTPGEIFTHVLKEIFFQNISTETNRYAEEQIRAKEADGLSVHSRARKWSPTDSVEMKAFVSLLLIMGLVREPNYDMYWTTNYFIQLPGVRSIMSRDRFYLLLQFFHVCNNSQAHPREHPNHDRLYKIRNVITHFIETAQSAYHPAREISVDESIIAFKGRCSMIMYKPNKPHKWGLNAWALCESKTGYVFNWELYQGRMNNVPEIGLTQDVFMRLTAPLHEEGHHVYMDNYFTSPDLFAALADKQVGACGTLRPTRSGTPQTIKNSSLRSGDPTLAVRDGILLFISWFDKRTVNILTTIHNSTTFRKSVKARHTPGNIRIVEKPKAIQLYTMNMGGVDRADQALWYSLNTHRTLKWWKKVFIYLLELCVVNSWIIYKQFHPSATKHGWEKFRMDICQFLLSDHVRSNSRPGRPLSDPPARLTERHFLENVTNSTAAGRKFPGLCCMQ